MGWWFRKSKKIGAANLTVSKGGIGIAPGVPGARIGIGADGRTRGSVGIPGTGLGYRAGSEGRTRGNGCLVALGVLFVCGVVVTMCAKAVSVAPKKAKPPAPTSTRRNYGP
jgi:hypothetical protein